MQIGPLYISISRQGATLGLFSSTRFGIIVWAGFWRGEERIDIEAGHHVWTIRLPQWFCLWARSVIRPRRP